ncbi:hypothetical protein B0J18DRAFT_474681 [Chaetomium sp. MPI-SDFR-AT-0129]|nr:hypothetical protein B0J18DRAFT_474681 [Chaetomium sp. MPI-SDFR-AT-0129]
MPSSAGKLLVDPDLAYRCLKSVSLNQTLATSYLSEITKYTQFQSTLSNLKNPPSDFYWPAVDLIGELESISKDLSTGHYTSQYDLDIDIAKVWASAHDGHFHTATCTAGGISFERSVYLISVSPDGLKDPLVYVYEVESFLRAEAFYNLADPDSAWNYLFWNTARDPAKVPLSATFTFPSSVFNWYPGKSTTIGFANGTSKSYDTKAVVETATWSENITDGEAFFQYYCVKPALDAAAAASSPPPSHSSGSQTSAAIPAVTGIFQHPSAVVQDPFEVVAGYYLKGSGYEDVAILWVAQFLAMIDLTNPVQMETLRNVTRDFLADAVAAGKKRLVLDVSGNLGGISNSPIEIFDRLFPSARTKVEMHVNYELTEPVKLFTDSFGAIPLSAMAPKANDSETEHEIKMKALYNDYNFRTWEDVNGANFTSLAEFLTQNFIPFGYGPYYNASYQDPFKAENVVILSDGTCASACAVFLHFLAQLNIRTIAIGGLPGGKQMQAIGGTKGDQAASAAIIQEDVEILTALGAIQQEDKEYAESILPGLIPLPLGSIKGTLLREYGINTRNHILAGDTVPSMMRFEPADCHVYYTPENIADVEQMWRDAVDIAWSEKACAAGSISGNTTSNGRSGEHSTSGTGRVRIASHFAILIVAAVAAIRFM